ncbi:hypothetical protein [Methanoculleus sp.]|uniref:hypothetical protein n=1 Tax=Methanoculleus sp. TaxID=90427 RepID=UPI002FCC383F
MREEENGGPGLVVGGGQRIDDRCIIPIVRALVVYGGGSATVSLTPVALLVTEGDNEYLALLPGAPTKAGEKIEGLRADIEREKEKCTG